MLEHAYGLGQERAWAEAAEALRRALVEHPDDPFVLCWLGVTERELGLGSLALQRFKACLAARPRDPHVLVTAGNALAAVDDPDAEPALRAAAMLSPELALARWMYGAYLSREGLVDDALRELQAAAKLEPDESAISYELGVARALAGDFDGAVDELYRGCELSPDDGWIRIVLGLALVEEERGGEAATELARGARERPGDLGAQLLSALAAAAVGYEEVALEFVERARQSSVGHDAMVVDEVEERVEAGAEAAAVFLREQMQPPVLRERMHTRP